jgi:3-phosphoshikimate 1-carboxyvinyltransferase
MILRVSPSKLRGTIVAPPSKSVAQRAIAAAAMAPGASMIRRIGDCDDVTALLGAVAALGAEVELGEQDVRISGFGGIPVPRMSVISLAESGLGIRMLAPLTACGPVPVTLTGSGTLLSRPLEALEHMQGAQGIFTTDAGTPPLRICGPMQPGDYRIDGALSSQFVTGMLMALPTLAGDSRLIVEHPTSQPYIQLTLEMLQFFGIEIRVETNGVFFCRGGQTYHPQELQVDGDWSAAASLLVAGMLAADPVLTVEGLNNRFPQADEAVRGALLFAGGAASGTDSGIQVAQRPVRAFDVNLEDSPDLFPVLAALAAFADKPSRLRGARRLAFKETDRATAIVECWKSAGIEVTREDDALVIHPRKGPEKVLPTRIHARNDHRMAMAAALLGLAGAPIEIEGAECVAKSYPAFFDDLEDLGAQIRWVSQA